MNTATASRGRTPADEAAESVREADLGCDAPKDDLDDDPEAKASRDAPPRYPPGVIGTRKIVGSGDMKLAMVSVVFALLLAGAIAAYALFALD